MKWWSAWRCDSSAFDARRDYGLKGYKRVHGASRRPEHRDLQEIARRTRSASAPFCPLKNGDYAAPAAAAYENSSTPAYSCGLRRRRSEAHLTIAIASTRAAHHASVEERNLLSSDA